MVLSTSLRLHELRRNDESASVDALILFLHGEGEQALVKEIARHWASAVPRAAFAGLQLDLDARRIDLPRLRDLIEQAAQARRLQGRQIVMVGVGRAGRLAIDLSILGVAPGAAVMALDLPLDAVPTNLAPLEGGASVLLISLMASGWPTETRDSRPEVRGPKPQGLPPAELVKLNLESRPRPGAPTRSTSRVSANRQAA